MFNQIDQGWSPTSYSGFRSLRASVNAFFTMCEDDNRYVVTAMVSGLKIICEIAKGSAEAADFESTAMAYANAPAENSEVRFYTHDFCDPADWDGRTLGAQASWVADAVAYDENTYRWLDALGVTVAWLDTSAFPSVWRNAANEPIVVYDPVSEHWQRVDTGADVTNSRWRVKPESGYKIEMLEAWTQADLGALIQDGGALHYEAHSYVPAGHPMLPPGAPGGIYKVKDWTYDSMGTLEAGADGLPYIEPITRVGHTGPVKILGYTYSKTKPPVLDSLYGQFMDIVLDGHKKILNSKEATGTFIGLKWRSF